MILSPHWDNLSAAGCLYCCYFYIKALHYSILVYCTNEHNLAKQLMIFFIQQFLYLKRETVSTGKEQKYSLARNRIPVSHLRVAVAMWSPILCSFLDFVDNFSKLVFPLFINSQIICTLYTVIYSLYTDSGVFVQTHNMPWQCFSKSFGRKRIHCWKQEIK